MMKWLVAGAAAVVISSTAVAQDAFDWEKHDGEELNLLLNNHPWTQAVRDMADEFTETTGIDLNIEVFNEEQFRARLTTLMQAQSSDIDVFMSLKSREGQVFHDAGWYADLGPMIEDASVTAPDYAFEDFGQALRAAETIDGQIVGVPLNIEGPLFYWRKDVFEACGIEVPAALEDILPAAEALRECDPDIIPWSARGLRSAVPYALAAFVFNMGGDFSTEDGQPGLCQPNTVKALDLYATLLGQYGPPGAANHTFTQVIELLGQGRVAMAHESSNEFANIMRFPGRAEDLGVAVLPESRETGISKPVVIGWGLSISDFSENKEAAWYFLQWVTSPEIQERLVAAGVAPPRTSVFEGEAFRTWASEMPIRQAWADALVEIARTGTSVYQTPTTRIPEARDMIGNAIQQIMLGEVDAKTAACAADEDLATLQ